MSFKQMNFEWFKSRIGNLDYSNPDTNRSYQYSYPYLINYFKDADTLNKEHLVIGAHAVYGWMPTILNLKKHENDTDSSEINLNDEIVLLNKAKKGESLDEKELDLLKRRINNSMVGLSKLLHFVNPDNYAIWDSRIYIFISGNKTASGIDSPKNYLEYLEGCKRIACEKEFSEYRNENPFSFENEGLYHDIEISDFRYIELALFRVTPCTAK